MEVGVVKKFKSPSLWISMGALFLALSGGAYAATNLIGTSQIRNGAVTRAKISHESVGFPQLSTYLQGQVAAINHRVAGPQGPKGETGAIGATGPRGPQGDAGFTGAFYSVEKYTSGISSSGIATAACDPNDDANSQNYVAIEGGVQATDNSTAMNSTTPLPIAASFPGRMNWSTFTPKPNRFDGWIVQMATGYSGATDDTPAEVWALCVPASDFGSSGVRVVTNTD
jgi:hypothetical protein